MNLKLIHGIITIAMIVTGSTLIGMATSWYVGAGLLFLIWGFGGLLESIFERVR